MAKIDITKIENFDTMTVEEQLQALQDFEYEEQDNSKYDNLKKLFDKNASELAQAKRELKTKMTEEEVREQERSAEYEAMKTELSNYKRTAEIASHKAEYVSQGYDEKLALETAEAMVDGDSDTVFRNMRKQNIIIEQNLRATILKDTPPPVPDGHDEEVAKTKALNLLRESMGLTI